MHQLQIVWSAADFRLLEQLMRIPLNQEEVEALRTKVPELRNDYLRYMAEMGWGEAPSGHMVYDAPIHASDIFLSHSDNLSDVVLLGDDFQGYCIGFDRQQLNYGEISDFGEWEESFEIDIQFADIVGARACKSLK